MTGVFHVTKSEQPCHSGTGWHGMLAFVHRHSSWIDTIPMKEFHRKSLFDLVSKYYWYYAEARWLLYRCSDRSSHCNPFGIKIVRKIKEKQDLTKKCWQDPFPPSLEVLDNAFASVIKHTLSLTVKCWYPIGQWLNILTLMTGEWSVSNLTSWGSQDDQGETREVLYDSKSAKKGYNC